MSTPAAVTLSAKDYKTELHPIWCPGCGDFGVLNALHRALAAQQIAPENLVMVSGIGCSSRAPHFVNAYGFHTVHGRALPIATGVKEARPELEVIAVGGDGDFFAIGMGHLPHAARRNPDVCCIIMDNEIYGLTKGQASPTSKLKLVTGSTPYELVDQPINPIALAIVSGATFVARGYSGKPKELADLIIQAMQHKGFAVLQVISPCVTFHNIFEDTKAGVRDLAKEHNPKDKAGAIKLAIEGNGMEIGIFYREERATLEQGIAYQKGKAAGGAPSRKSDMSELILKVAREEAVLVKN
ncbi:MAG TPA: 2-oxoacid:ferredoxin oxidoreductase subunit beta [Candidatus Thermoplasmatota archaeon]|nr:2-oxoacid:ferredoxin oxidoreductase subunit beta [Candidatus Thermoplasmatota archaeon]